MVKHQFAVLLEQTTERMDLYSVGILNGQVVPLLAYFGAMLEIGRAEASADVVNVVWIAAPLYVDAFQ